MPLTDRDLDEVVYSWHKYVEDSPKRIKAQDLFAKRDLRMYQGMGVKTAEALASKLVHDRSVASMEMTMGYLYELVIKALGFRKLTNKEKKEPGYRGIDFRHDTHKELWLINLKSGLSTSNADISGATKRNLLEAKKYWDQKVLEDDNPLSPHPEVLIIRAVARSLGHK